MLERVPRKPLLRRHWGLVFERPVAYCSTVSFATSASIQRRACVCVAVSVTYDSRRSDNRCGAYRAYVAMSGAYRAYGNRCGMYRYVSRIGAYRSSVCRV